MKILRFTELKDLEDEHILRSVLPGKYLYSGGLDFSIPGSRSHTNDGHENSDHHVHDDFECFVIFQGEGFLEINKEFLPITSGDVIVIEPGEDHHLISDKHSPLVTLWCHAGPDSHFNAIYEK